MIPRELLAHTVHTLVEAQAPIGGISIGNRNDKTTWQITFKPEATPAQRSAAQGVIDTFDLTTDLRSALAKALDAAIGAMPPIDPRIKAVFVEWRKQIN